MFFMLKWFCLINNNELSQKKTGFNLYQSRHCAYITYSVKTWFLTILYVAPYHICSTLCGMYYVVYAPSNGRLPKKGGTLSEALC